MKVLLVDGLNLIRRIHAAVPDHAKTRQQPDGMVHLNRVLQASTASLQRALGLHKPSHCLVVLEQSGKNWRHQLFPGYKQDRRPMPKALESALPRFTDAFNHLGVQSFSKDGYETDDVIATIATKVAEHNGQVTILSTDRNYGQLLSEHIRIYDHFAQHYLDHALIHQRFSVKVHQLPDLLALSGDRSLSVPGIKSIGKRTAAKLVNDHGSLEKILDAAPTMPGKLGAKLLAGQEDAIIARRLFKLKTDLQLGINLNQIRLVPKENGNDREMKPKYVFHGDHSANMALDRMGK